MGAVPGATGEAIPSSSSSELSREVPLWALVRLDSNSVDCARRVSI